MLVWQACAWGGLGVLLNEAWTLSLLLSKDAGWPWRTKRNRKFSPYFGALGLRLFMGTGVPFLYASTSQISGPLAAVTLGITAPLAIAQLAAQAPPPPPPPAPEPKRAPRRLPVSSALLPSEVAAPEEGA